ncbi:hypothetical protein Vadar_030670 [Vaccinium darrowii]|uniref:Uncharacterized protein n=1 Tax=Vaccinium darrowii TaxID=229202 RepID=A0ACB7Z7Y8_9ERIC|nr:hypothetical protein Vadar_030670 [Vaccinium darrowii]
MGRETKPLAYLPPPMSTKKAAAAAATTTTENDCCECDILKPVGFILFGTLMSYLFTLIANYDCSIIPKFQIESISVPPFTITEGWNNNRIRILPQSDVDLNFTVTNPSSDRDMICDNLLLLVSYKKELILGGFLAPFHQDAGEEKTVHETVGAASPGFVNNLVIARSLVSAKAVNFTVRVDGRVKYAPGTSSEKVHGLKVLCENVEIGYPPDCDSEAAGTMLAKPEECRVAVVEAFRKKVSNQSENLERPSKLKDELTLDDSLQVKLKFRDNHCFLLLSSKVTSTENDLVNVSSWKTCDETVDEMEADGRRRGVPTQLEVSLPTGEGLLEIIMVGGCNSISRSAAASALGLSINLIVIFLHRHHCACVRVYS